MSTALLLRATPKWVSKKSRNLYGCVIFCKQAEKKTLHFGLYEKAAPESFSFEEKLTLTKKCSKKAIAFRVAQ